MTDTKELRRLAESVKSTPWRNGDGNVEELMERLSAFHDAASPSVVLALLDEVESRQWVSLADRKPPEWEQVLVALDTGAVVTGFRGSAGWHWDDTSNEADAEANATHWMPMPKAPVASPQPEKEEGKE